MPGRIASPGLTTNRQRQMSENLSFWLALAVIASAIVLLRRWLQLRRPKRACSVEINPLRADRYVVTIKGWWRPLQAVSGVMPLAASRQTPAWCRP